MHTHTHNTKMPHSFNNEGKKSTEIIFSLWKTSAEDRNGGVGQGSGESVQKREGKEKQNERNEN